MILMINAVVVMSMACRHAHT